jgi:hypothetical protein
MWWVWRLQSVGVPDASKGNATIAHRGMDRVSGMMEGRPKGRGSQWHGRRALVLSSADGVATVIVRLKSSKVLCLNLGVEVVLPFRTKGRWFVVIEVILVLGGFKEVLPLGILKVDEGVGVRVNRGEPRVEDAVKLWADETRVEIEDERSCGGVFTGENKKDGTARARLPPWKFLAILHGRVKDVNWGPPNS